MITYRRLGRNCLWAPKYRCPWKSCENIGCVMASMKSDVIWGEPVYGERGDGMTTRSSVKVRKWD